MKRSNLSVKVANMVMEAISDLQKAGEKCAMKDIRQRICDKYGGTAEKYARIVPSYVAKGMNLGIIAKHGDNYRTKMYVMAKRGRAHRIHHGRRHRRRSSSRHRRRRRRRH